jgi:trehalose 6-phosphate phosphatase
MEAALPTSPLLGPPPPSLDWGYFLDLDGTLIDLAERPDAVTVEPALPGMLLRLRDMTGGAAAIVTGRPIQVVDRLFATPGAPLAGLPVAGLHGLERRRPDGRLLRTPPAAAALERVRQAFLAFASGDDRLLVEDKGLTIALHFRLAPARAGEIAALVADLAERVVPDLAPVTGKAVVEFKPPGIDKGSAIAAYLAEPPFLHRRPVFIGDDVTDEDGFIEVERRGGVTIRVGQPAAATRARHGLATVTAVHAWLRELTG